MSSKPPRSPLPPPLPPRKSSGQHPAVTNFRRRLESIDERTMPKLIEQEKRLEAEISQTIPPAEPTPLEGDWVITIRGRGPHHNASATDANRLAGDFVRTLTATGQTVVGATFKNGLEEPITTGELA